MIKKQNFHPTILCLSTLALLPFWVVCETSTSAIQADAVVGAALYHKAKQRKRTNFKELEIIKMIDGKYGMFDGKSVLESYQLLFKLQTIQYGEQDRTTGKRVGLYQLDEKKATLQDLVIEEQRLIKEKVAKDDMRWKKLNAALTAAKDDFNDKLRQLRKAQDDNEMIKNMKHKLIAFFLKDQGRETSLMANADHPDEKKRMYEASALEFFTFLNDLKHFIEDMVDSCPEAHKQYKELLQKPH